ncbi:hypothetical protein [Sorangium sp. So ce426]|uniref:vWA domain-containing protein n=1 Tax=Sorangium sp. So ce426 TaxID=3133312 RepID=UPI003F5C8260
MIYHPLRTLQAWSISMRCARNILYSITLTAFAHSALACGSDDPVPPSTPSLTVEFQRTPLVQSANGRTVVLVDFVVRRADRTPLEPADVDVVLSVDSKKLDVESLLTKADKRLKANLNLHLVLDASFSMLSQPLKNKTNTASNAFELMLSTAAESRDKVRTIWRNKSEDATVNVELTLFDKWIYHADGEWTDAQIMDFPPPGAGTETKLLGATHFAATRMKAQHDSMVASGERDKHVMIAFTDGQDNISTLDNTESPDPTTCPGFCSPPTRPRCQDGSLVPNCPNESDGLCHTAKLEAPYTSVGYPCVDRSAVADAFLGHPSLEVHVIGLGSEVDESELEYLASYGHGSFVQGGAADDIPQLFADVLKEFVTINSQGADIPQPAGNYRFSLEITDRERPSSRARCSFGYSNDPDEVGSLKSERGNCRAWPEE